MFHSVSVGCPEFDLTEPPKSASGVGPAGISGMASLFRKNADQCKTSDERLFERSIGVGGARVAHIAAQARLPS
jgi:hypothetical protein